MHKDLKIYRPQERTQEWFDLRGELGIGASEIATSLRMDKFKSAIRLAYEKAGIAHRYDEDNNFMFWGRKHENTVAATWEHWGPNGYIENANAGITERRCRNFKGMFTNPRYPWLFVSPDRLINKGQFTVHYEEKNGKEMLVKGPINDDIGALEIKNISGYASSLWEGGIPPGYIFQVHGYFIILGIDYGEIAVLKDGRDFFVLPVRRSQIIVDRILEDTHKFWYKRVLPMREAYAGMQNAASLKDREIFEARIHQLEPPPDGSDDYREFMSERFKQEVSFIRGNTRHYELAVRQKALSFCMKIIESEKHRIENMLIRDHRDYNVKRINLEKDGKDFGHTLYFKKASNENYQLGNYIKIILDEDFIQQSVKNLLLEIK